MPKVPAHVTIGGIRFRVLVRELDEWGQLLFDKREIHVSTRAMAKASSLRETLRHEILHAALHVAGVSFSERYDEESTVRAIEHIFFPAWERTRNQLTP